MAAADRTAANRRSRRRWLGGLAVALAVVALVAFFAALPTPPAEGDGGATPGGPRLDGAPVPAGTFAVTAVRLFDGEAVIPRADVLVRDGSIAAVGPDLEIPAEVPRIDGAGRTLLPGLVDAHVHAYGDALEQAARFGVTTVFDMFTDPGWAAEVKRRQAADGHPGAADLRTAGHLATAPGGHGTQFGMEVPVITGDTDADAWVKARRAEGSDYVKIVLESGAGMGLDLPTLSADQVAALAAAAHRHGLMAVAHVGTVAEARTALEAGVDGLVHLAVDRPMDAALVRLAAERGAFVVPTLTVLEGFTGGPGGAALADDPRIADRLTADQATGLRRPFSTHTHGELAHALDAVARLAAAGVPVLAGSDAPNPGTAQGASLHRELELLVEAGLEPVAALAAATSVPARVFGLADRGRIAGGMRADLVLVEEDPTRDVTATRALLAVWKQGRPVRLEPPAAAGPTEERPRVEPGPVSTFDDPVEPTARIGMGRWMPSTDERMGGSSTVELAVDGGALHLRGELVQAFAYPWAGAILFPAAEPMAPADLSAAAGVAFRARGARPDTLRLYLFAPDLGPVPAIRELPLGTEWREYRVPFSELGIDGSAVQGLMLAGGAAPGPFELWIDDVGLYAAGDGAGGR